jgi:hypothetical protein
MSAMVLAFCGGPIAQKLSLMRYAISMVNG